MGKVDFPLVQEFLMRFDCQKVESKRGKRVE